MIEVTQVDKYFGKIRALHNVSFSAQTGDIVGLLGPNGAGKTTLMRILGCYTPPSQGKVSINSLDIHYHSLEIRRNLGYFQEKVSIYPEMRVYAFLRFMAQIKNVPRSETKEQIYKTMHQCGIEHVKNRIIGSLSKGYQQRIGFAQALLNDPNVLLLDEPTAGVDPNQVVEIRHMIKDIGARRTIILSSHILSEVTEVCNKIIILNNGQVVVTKSPDQLHESLNEKKKIKVQIQAFDHHNVLSELKSAQGIMGVQEKDSNSPETANNIATYILTVDEDEGLFNKLCQLSYEHNWEIKEFQTDKLSLEEVFIQLTSKE